MVSTAPISGYLVLWGASDAKGGESGDCHNASSGNQLENNMPPQIELEEGALLKLDLWLHFLVVDYSNRRTLSPSLWGSI